MASANQDNGLPATPGTMAGFLYDVWKTSGVTGLIQAASPPSLGGGLPTATANFYSGSAPETKPLLNIQHATALADSAGNGIDVSAFVPDIKLPSPSDLFPSTDGTSATEWAAMIVGFLSVVFLMIFLFKVA